MNPFWSLSKTLKASFSSSSESVSFIFLAIRLRNSGKSMVPLPSASTSLIMSWSSASVGFCPSDLITVPSSLVLKASLNSEIWSSVS
ncbi:hypothetical protein CRG98_020691 [Punica granatum]|uniref:Uncharacterized protein n=1 Tax=Punica granatum TaxID=22663 RepID=A0A2I0JRL7_PUNGR|nr:hypothetical protein CRG98_020691 [Punica granatum]